MSSPDPIKIELAKRGRAIAREVRWDGERIVEIFQSALEDANYHTFNAVVAAAWQMQIKAQEDVADAFVCDYHNDSCGWDECSEERPCKSRAIERISDGYYNAHMAKKETSE
jgi:hypothetical protein